LPEIRREYRWCQIYSKLEREGKSPLTIQAYAKDIEQFMDWLDETIGYATEVITETDIREYRQYLNLHKKLKVTKCLTSKNGWVNRLKSKTKIRKDKQP
ncbi:phage integrase N-terminal SAM-like domain-containing protein, partial [Leptospira santarosai]|nr:phage integrase N-terminal SAM-like domain-containing protein [Leptospira santarosai]